jgi:phosphoribosyl 1,2-cyclic phosphodiesterase
MSLELKYWGVRGSAPVCSAETAICGGDTACIEVRGGSAPLILDLGSGAARLGRTLCTEFPDAGECSVFLTHFHWDHIQGLTAFEPLFDKRWSVRFFSSHSGLVLERILSSVLQPPYFPLEWAALPARIECLYVPPEGIEAAGFQIEPIRLNHPGGATGYRIERGNATIVYATDHEHGDRSIDDRLVRQSNGADLLIYDAQYSPEEYLSHGGFGHSTWAEAACVARRAGVHELSLFHHDPRHDDRDIEAIAEAARAIFPDTVCAAAGLTQTVGYDRNPLEVIV